MCYKSPGPRCSAHAYGRLRRATRMYLAAVSGNHEGISRLMHSTPKNRAIAEQKIYYLYEDVKAAQADFDQTPKGQELLRKKISELPKSNAKRHVYENRLERGIQQRKLALQALNLEDKGDVNKAPSRHAKIEDRVSPEALRQRGKLIAKAAELATKITDSSDDEASVDLLAVATDDLTLSVVELENDADQVAKRERSRTHTYISGCHAVPGYWKPKASAATSETVVTPEVPKTRQRKAARVDPKTRKTTRSTITRAALAIVSQKECHGTLQRSAQRVSIPYCH